MELSTVVCELEAARTRSAALLDPLDEEVLERQHSSLMSPLVWDMAHVANYEELWLLRALGANPVRSDLDNVYDAFRHPRASRASLDLLGPEDARSYRDAVRSRALDVLDAVDPDQVAATTGRPPADSSARRRELLTRGFVYGMVVQHEHQHVETMLATLQLAGQIPPVAGSDPAPLRGGRATGPEEVLVAGGSFVMGTDTEPWAYDNERPAHTVELAPFWIDTSPVSNGRYLAFVDAGGYEEPRWWSPEGWRWREEAHLQHPGTWRRDGDGSWWRTSFGQLVPLELECPVQHVCWHEAEAFARFAGGRLPTEAEWEMAATWSPDGRKQRYPWGDVEPTPDLANLGAQLLGPVPAGTRPAGVSPWGCQQMIGDVWEWTSSRFSPYPGFASFPYREYSEVFYGPDYRVLRGGSWATHAGAARGTFRNWDFPIRRQIFAGFRCARDAR